MCTVSWTSREDHGYQLVFSRDEQRTRGIAGPPRALADSGVTLLAPHDPEGGGTWIFANGFGLTACLLNFYDAPAPPPPPPEGRESRGRLLAALAPLPNANSLGRRLAQLVTPGRHLPCIVLALESSGQARGWTWDGRRLGDRSVITPGLLTTSSVDSPRVVAARQDAFAAWREKTGTSLLDFHRATSAVAGPLSVRMSRPDARTVSLTEVIFESVEGRVSMTYSPREADGDFAPGQTWHLPICMPCSSA